MSQPSRPLGISIAVAAALRDQIKDLATLHTQDAFYAQAADQLAAIVAGLEKRASINEPPGPGAIVPPQPY